jgi:hypothetical protein
MPLGTVLLENFDGAKMFPVVGLQRSKMPRYSGESSRSVFVQGFAALPCVYSIQRRLLQDGARKAIHE